MSIVLSAEARGRLDTHLDAVERVLVSAGHAREQRRAVMDDLEAQILEMLAARSATPTLADVEAVLAQLDAPAAYASAGREIPPASPARPPQMPAPARPRYSRTAIWGLVCILVSVLSIFCVLPLGFFFMAAPSEHRVENAKAMVGPYTVEGTPPTTGETHPRTVPSQEHTLMLGLQDLPEHHSVARASRVMWGPLLFLLIPLCPFGLLGTLLGWVAFAQIRGSKGALVGTGMALFDGLVYPTLFLLAIVVMAAAAIF